MPTEGLCAGLGLAEAAWWSAKQMQMTPKREENPDTDVWRQGYASMVQLGPLLPRRWCKLHRHVHHEEAFSLTVSLKKLFP